MVPWFESRDEWFDEWRKRRAKGVIKAYLAGVGSRTTLKWCTGCLTGSFGVNRVEALALIEEIEKNSAAATPTRKAKLKKLKEALAGAHLE